ncbi:MULTISPECIES: LuxR family transcriptional regulator [unclassified Streptomyces]|uniref:ATP-binding protein n=1 Tax=unclassified Streptomyces TaxID=2593676 RepID=UPI00336A724C
MLHERDAELAQITGALQAAREGRPSLVLLTGPLGIGRSALLQRLPALSGLNEAEDVRVLRANAAPVEEEFGFGVVRQLFDSLLAGAPRELCERWTRESACFADLALADEPLPADGRPTAAYEPVLGGLRSLLAGVCADGPLLILVDDLQWVDTPSLRWLAYLAKRLRGLRAVVVCTLRDGEPRARHPLLSEVVEAATYRLRLRPLSSAATAELIRDHFGEQGETEFVRACHETCAGNPLSLTSLLLDLAAAGHRPTADRVPAVHAACPSDLRERLARCVRLQPRPVRDLGAAIAALGDPGDPALVPRLAGLDPIGYAAALRALHALGLAADEREPRFVHPVVADAVQSSLSVAELERLHDRAAELLYRAGRSEEQVAAQLMAGVTSRHPWSVGVLRAAADVALRRGAPEVAVRYLRRALLDASLSGEGRARLLIDLATAERGLDPVACERHISQAIPMLPTAGHRAAAALRLTPAVMGLLRPSAVDLLRQVADGLGPPDALEGAAREAAVRLEARLRQSGIDDPAELASAVERLDGMGEEPPMATAAERELVAVLVSAATLTCRLPAAEVTRLAKRLLEREPVASARVYSALPLATVALVAADSVEAVGSWLSVEQRINRSRAAATVGTAGTIVDGFGHLERATVLMARGRPTQAHAHAERALRLSDAHWHELGVAATIALVRTALEIGDPALSERVLDEASRRSSSCLPLAAAVQFLGASVDAHRGRWTAAVETLMACGRRLEAASWRNPVLFPWRLRAAGLYQRLGDTRSALALAEEDLLRAEEWGAPVAIGRALRLKGTLLGGETGEGLLREAVGVLRESANELELARTLLLLGRRLEGRAEVEDMLREAAELAAECEAPWLVERARSGGGDGTIRLEDALTRTERRVVTLAGRGLTNTEIAGELGVTSRAVEKHLTNSYRKLSVSGRRELIAALPRLQAAKGS